MRYVGPITKLPLVAALLISIIFYAVFGNPIEAISEAFAAYLICRWLVVPFFAKRVYTYICTDCNQYFETKILGNTQCNSCFQTTLESILTPSESSIKEAERLRGKKRIFSGEAANEAKIQAELKTGEFLYCRHCGQRIVNGNFCSSCGQKL